MVCSRCQTEIPPSAKFCSQCGKSVQSEDQDQKKSLPAGPFTDNELAILLEANRRSLHVKSNPSIVSQDDIDKLFE